MGVNMTKMSNRVTASCTQSSGGRTAFVLLLVLCLLHGYVYRCSALNIYVIQSNDTSDDCCQEGGSCRTLNEALQCLKQHNQSTVWIEPGTYHLNATDIAGGETHYEFNWMRDIAIVAVADPLDQGTYSEYEIDVHIVCSDVSKQNGAGLTFLNSTNVTIRGILFDACGVYHYSTSKSKVNSDTNFFQFFTTLYFMLCTDISLEYVHINGTNGIGAVLYSTVGNNRIQSCNFSHNAVKDVGNIPGGGGVYVEFSYCLPLSGDNNDACDNKSNVPPPNSSGAHYEIEFNTFYRNSATVTNATDLTFILPHLNDHVAFSRGGGLSVFFKGDSSGNTVVIGNCTFSGNEALWGAGLFVEYQDNAQNNTVEISSSLFDHNTCYDSELESKGTGGGGARIGYIFFNETYGSVTQNNMTFKDVVFLENKAYFGGGLSFYTAREPKSISSTNGLNFVNCSWQKNVARVGSAADLSVWHPIPSGAVVKPSFSSCRFSHNSAAYTTQLGFQVGIGALYLDSIPVTFSETVQFISNNQTALASINTGLYFEQGCHAKFVDNQGRNGGAIALMGNSFIRVSRQTQMQFVNNFAELRGGAIFGESVGEHDLISSRNCFIRYEDVESTPLNWSANFKFENNSAGNGRVNSIHVTSLLTCLWGGAFGSTETIQEAANKVFCWSDDNWSYSSNCSEEISTSPARFSTHNGSADTGEPTYDAMVIPGMKTLIDMSTFDDRNYNVTGETVFTAKLLLSPDSHDAIDLDNNSLYISDRSFELYGKPGVYGTLRLETIEPRVISTELNVALQPCPPGMVESGNGSMTACRCMGNYGGYIECNSTTFSAKILRGSWIGQSRHRSNATCDLDVSSDDLLVGQCPYCSLLGSDLFIPLGQSTCNLSNVLCNKINRTGELCGHCQLGYGPIVNGDLECVLCPPNVAKYHWIFYLMTEYLPIVIFFFIVVFFNVSATSGPANAFVFFAQVITTAFSPTGNGAIQIHSIVNSTHTLKHLYTIPYDIWNLNFFHPCLPKFCLSSEITTLQLLSTGYITAVFPFFLVVVFYLFVWLYSHGFAPIVCLCRPLHHCFARVRSIWNLERSVLHALATFLLLSYTKFSLVSFILLTPTPLLNNDGSKNRSVLYYDGTIDWFSSHHAPFVVASLLVLFTFVLLPPLILMLPSFSHLVRVCLQKTIKYEGNVLSYQVGSVTGQFMTAFYECYKDGTGDLSGHSNNNYDFRWFSGMYFVLRLMVFAVFAFTPDTFTLYLILQLICISGILAFAVFRPYKNNWYNNLDAAMFTVLAAINTLSMYNYFLAVVNKAPSETIFFIQYFLIICPLMYIAIFVTSHLYKKYVKRIVRCFKRTWPFSKLFSAGDSDGDDRDFLAYTEETGRLRGELEYSINITEARRRQRSILEELNHSGNNKESQPLILEDPSAETPAKHSGNSSGSSGYGATGSAREASPGLSEVAEEEDKCGELPVSVVERLGIEEPATTKKRRERLYRTR